MERHLKGVGKGNRRIQVVGGTAAKGRLRIVAQAVGTRMGRDR